MVSVSAEVPRDALARFFNFEAPGGACFEKRSIENYSALWCGVGWVGKVGAIHAPPCEPCARRDWRHQALVCEWGASISELQHLASTQGRGGLQSARGGG